MFPWQTTGDQPVAKNLGGRPRGSKDRHPRKPLALQVEQTTLTQPPAATIVNNDMLSGLDNDDRLSLSSLQSATSGMNDDQAYLTENARIGVIPNDPYIHGWQLAQTRRQENDDRISNMRLSDLIDPARLFAAFGTKEITRIESSEADTDTKFLAMCKRDPRLEMFAAVEIHGCRNRLIQSRAHMGWERKLQATVGTGFKARDANEQAFGYEQLQAAMNAQNEEQKTGLGDKLRGMFGGGDKKDKSEVIGEGRF